MLNESSKWKALSDAAGIVAAHGHRELSEKLIEHAEALSQREAQEPVAWALIWEADGERHLRLYDEETHCVFDAESDGGVCRPLVFPDTAPPSREVPEVIELLNEILNKEKCVIYSHAIGKRSTGSICFQDWELRARALLASKGGV